MELSEVFLICFFNLCSTTFAQNYYSRPRNRTLISIFQLEFRYSHIWEEYRIRHYEERRRREEEKTSAKRIKGKEVKRNQLIHSIFYFDDQKPFIQSHGSFGNFLPYLPSYLTCHSTSSKHFTMKLHCNTNNIRVPLHHHYQKFPYT